MDDPVLVDKYDMLVWQNQVMDALRPDNCLCLHCGRLGLQDETIGRCKVAASLLTLCKTYGMAMMVTRCRDWVAPGKVVQAPPAVPTEEVLEVTKTL